MSDATRRVWIKRVSLATLGAVYGCPSVTLLAQEELEEHVFDPDAPSEPLKFNRALAERPLQISSKGPKKDPKGFASKLLAISSKYADQKIGRDSTPDQV